MLTQETQINHILQLYSSGNVSGAHSAARTLTETFPDCAFGWKLLGITYALLGCRVEALDALQKMVQLVPDDPEAYSDMALVLQQNGRTSEAVATYLKAIELKPDFAEAHYNLGNAYQNLELTEEAIASYREAIKFKPDLAAAHGNLGTLLGARGQHEEAVVSYCQAITLKPDYAIAYANLGGAFDRLGQYEEAISSYRKAIQFNPHDADSYYYLGVLLNKLGNVDEAIANLRQATAIRHDFVDAHNDLGKLHSKIGQADLAIASFNRILAIKPDSANTYNNLGGVYNEKGLTENAIASYRRALEIKPDFAEAYNNLGAALYSQNNLDGALQNFRIALNILPDNAEVHNSIGLVTNDLGDHDAAVASCRRALELKPDFEDAHSNLLFCVNYHPELSAEDIYGYYRDYDARFGEPLRTTWSAHSNLRIPEKRLKIGYVSPTFHRHSVRYFLEPLLARHDPTQVELYAYAQNLVHDEVTIRYQNYVQHWVNTYGMSDETFCQRVRADGIDILVDIAGHTAGNRLQVFARKPAPVSLHWLDFGYTTGLQAIDYYLTDKPTIPEGSEHLFSETPWRLPTPAYAYRPAEGMGEVNQLPALERGYITFGTLTRAVRINEKVIRTWSAILKAIPNAKLVINSSNYQNAVMCDLLADKFLQHGVTRESLQMGSSSPPWDVLRGIDIGLDCFPHNSGTTLFEMLYLGIPFVTLAGRPSVGRLGASILHGLGHVEWIAESEEEYIAKAVSLAGDLERLSELRRGLRAEMQASPLMDEVGFARAVEDAYREMWKRWCTA